MRGCFGHLLRTDGKKKKGYPNRVNKSKSMILKNDNSKLQPSFVKRKDNNIIAILYSYIGTVLHKIIVT